MFLRAVVTASGVSNARELLARVFEIVDKKRALTGGLTFGPRMLGLADEVQVAVVDAPPLFKRLAHSVLADPCRPWLSLRRQIRADKN